MNNKQLNGIYFSARQDLIQSIDKFSALLNHEKFLLESYENEPTRIGKDGRNSKGEYVNLAQMRKNIEVLETNIKTIMDSFVNIIISSSIYK